MRYVITAGKVDGNYRAGFLVSTLAVLLFISFSVKAADIFLSAPPSNPGVDQIFDVEITVDVGSGTLGSYYFNLTYDSAIVNVVSIKNGASLRFSHLPKSNPLSFTAGVTPIASTQGSIISPTGLVSVAIITLKAVGLSGTVSPINVEVIELNDTKAIPLSVNVYPTAVQMSFNAADDTDGDGLTDLAEANAGTNINNPDTDGDGLKDGFEVLGGLDPLDNGTVDPNQGANGDPDGDGLTNLQEQMAGTNPTRADTDNDGLSDNVELTLGTNPSLKDTDGDGLSDAFEVNGNLDPLDDGTTNPANGAAGDPDADGLTNTQELMAGTLPNNPDTDGDGLPDGFEVNNGLNPLDNGLVDPKQGAAGDPDNDGYSNLKEFQIGSHPNNKYSQPVEVVLQLKPGLQPLFYPLDMPIGFSAFDLLAILNASGNVVASIQTISAGSVILTAQWNDGTPSGDDFIFTPGKGVLAHVTSSAIIPFIGPVQCSMINLPAGVNTVGFNCLPTGITAQQLLHQLGNALQVSSISRFDSISGRYQTAVYESDFSAGDDFIIRVAETYLVHTLVDRTSFDPLQ